MAEMGLGSAETKSDLVVMPAEDKFFCFFALRVTVEAKFRVRLYRVEFCTAVSLDGVTMPVSIPIQRNFKSA
jgi:hypothetical protein